MNDLQRPYHLVNNGQGTYDPVVVHGQVVLTGEQMKQIDKQLSPLYTKIIQNQKELQELNKKSGELGLKSNELSQKSNNLGQKSNNLGQKSNNLSQKSNNLDQKSTDLGKTINTLNQKQDQLNTSMQNLDQKHQELIAKQFYSIFHGKNPIPTGQVSQIFNTYLANNNALSFEKSSDGTSYPQINSMHAVTRYLAEHSDVKSCDFRVFKTHINDIPVLAEYLKGSTVKAIAINNNISQSDKESLVAALTARKNGLKIQYFN